MIAGNAKRQATIEGGRFTLALPKLHRRSHFRQIFVEIVGALHIGSSGDVIDHPLGDVRCDTQRAEATAKCSADVVQSPTGDAAQFV